MYMAFPFRKSPICGSCAQVKANACPATYNYVGDSDPFIFFAYLFRSSVRNVHTVHMVRNIYSLYLYPVNSVHICS